MTNTYKSRYGDRLTFLFPEVLEVNRFELVECRVAAEINGIRHQDHTHFFTFTLLDEQPSSELNQALQSAIKNQKPVEITVFRNHEEAHKGYVVVKELKPKQANGYRMSVVKTLI
ncbi:YolD-like family protein [Aeromonas veronii]|uniref:YolD-like family protein n=1 Tax=Aeromonas veronii TaxID=654 RepID=UPI000D1036CF|nr:YolD-like family protein [Aeromonas veronii]PSJ85444.1 hypothetical protein CT153_21575 [Aeromonas veronii]